MVALALACATTHAGAQPPSFKDAPGFDTLYARLDEGALATATAVETQRWLAQLEAAVPAGDGPRELLYRAMRCDWDFVDEPNANLAYARDGLARAAAAGDDAAQVRFLYCAAATLETLGTARDALAGYATGIARARAGGHTRLLADGLAFRGGVYSLIGEQGQALVDLLEAQRLYRQLGRTTDAEYHLLNIAIAYRRLGELDKAAQYLAQSQAHLTAIGDRRSLFDNLLQQAFLAEDRGTAKAAVDIYRRVLALPGEPLSPYSIGAAQLGLGNAYRLDGQYALALATLERAERNFARVQDHSNASMIAFHRGQAEAGLGHHAIALRHYAAAADSLEREGNLRYLADFQLARSRSQEALGHYAASLDDLKRHLATRAKLEGSERLQQAQVLRYGFDVARTDTQNARLLADRRQQDARLAALLQAQRWQLVAATLAIALAVLLGTLALRQGLRARRLRRLVWTDALTGVASRRGIEREAKAMIEHARIAGEPLALLTCDIDFFKRINDTHGHQVGDEVLSRVARAAQATLREGDALGRTGGEEFLALLAKTRAEQGLQAADRLRAAVAATDMDDIAPGLRISISLGMTVLAAGDDLHELVRRADIALYRAKAQGRNRVEVEH